MDLFSNKSNAAQYKHPATDKELLAMDKGCQCFDNVIRGAEIIIHSDHQNLTFGDETRHVSQRVLRAQTRIKCDHGADIVHVKGEDNVGGDGLSRLDTEAEDLPEKDDFVLCELDVVTDRPKQLYLNLNLPTFDDIFPLDLENIARNQVSDSEHEDLLKGRMLGQC